jgi:hypothetical protein
MEMERVNHAADNATLIRPTRAVGKLPFSNASVRDVVIVLKN